MLILLKVTGFDRVFFNVQWLCGTAVTRQYRNSVMK